MDVSLHIRAEKGRGVHVWMLVCIYVLKKAGKCMYGCQSAYMCFKKAWECVYDVRQRKLAQNIRNRDQALNAIIAPHP
jgi:hypothetical protein